MSEDQNTFVSERWGELQFFPSKTNKAKDTCQHCLLNPRDEEPVAECHRAPCCKEERTDQREGYFSIHQMPRYQEL